MRLIRMLIQVTREQKKQLLTLRAHGFTEAGYVRHALGRALKRERRLSHRPKR